MRAFENGDRQIRHGTRKISSTIGHGDATDYLDLLAAA